VSVQIPRLAHTDVIDERFRIVLGENGDIVDAGVNAVAQCEIYDPVAAPEGQRGLRPVLGENRKLTAGSPGEYHGQNVQ
jgi:hypothetical protein